MAQAFILGHGARRGELADTFVPEGRTISFYAEFDEYSLLTIGLAALNNGSILPTETYEAGDILPNYFMWAFTDAEMAQFRSAESSQTNGTLYFVGAELDNPSLVCTTPNDCDATAPLHGPNCQGVFARIAEADIKSVACRSLSGDPELKITWALEGTTDLIDETRAEPRRILDWAQTDPVAAIAYYQSLSEATRAMLVEAHLPLGTWAEQHYAHGGTDTAAAVVEARNYLEQMGDIAFADYAEQFDERQLAIVIAERDLLEHYWLGFGRRMLRNDGAPAFWQFFSTQDEATQQLMTSDEEFASALGHGAQGAGVAQRSTWQPTEDDLDDAARLNEDFVKGLDEGTDATWEVGTFLVLLGQAGGELASRVRQQPDYATGTFRVRRAVFEAGSLEFDGVAPMHRATITAAIERFSRKDVQFT